MKKLFAITIFMLASPMVNAHPGHLEAGVFSDAAHLLLGLVGVVAVFGVAVLVARGINSIRTIQQ